MLIALGSTNPAKMSAVQAAFQALLPHELLEFRGVEVASGVAEQPTSDAETIKGARNRAQAALRKTAADLAVGLEGGLQKHGGSWYEGSWAAVYTKNGASAIGASPRILVIPAVAELIEQGKDLGQAVDTVFKTAGVGKQNGYFGVMTHDLLTRSDISRDAIIAAAAPLLLEVPAPPDGR